MSTVFLPPSVGEPQVPEASCGLSSSVPSDGRGADLLLLPAISLGAKAKDRTGNVVGRLTVLKPVKRQGPRNEPMWLCRCECGNHTLVPANHMHSGHTQSCGCYGRDRTSEASIKDMVGKTYANLTVLAFSHVHKKSQCALWICQCRCGTQKTIAGNSLRAGTIKSCGCLKYLPDLTGKVFDRLTVIEKAHTDAKGTPYYLCRCDCGNQTTVVAYSLHHRKTKSCGCLIAETHSKRLMGKRGAGTPHWNPQLPEADRQRQRCNMERLREQLFARDAYTCTCCTDSKGGNLNAHHMEPWSQDKELRYDLDNLITLCTKCHRAYHKQFPAKIANTENFIAWFAGQQKEKQHGTIQLAGSCRSQESRDTGSAPAVP